MSRDTETYIQSPDFRSSISDVVASIRKDEAIEIRTIRDIPRRTRLLIPDPCIDSPTRAHIWKYANARKATCRICGKNKTHKKPEPTFASL